ncbi:hypothetical protein, partial [Enterococcus faecium]|uniref:hypothetical protein n=1 Tax=Enterococcus faecium TaxID=1352 RepID=UPI00207317C1
IIGNPSLNHRYRKGFYSLFKTLQQNPHFQNFRHFFVLLWVLLLLVPLAVPAKLRLPLVVNCLSTLPLVARVSSVIFLKTTF